MSQQRARTSFLAAGRRMVKAGEVLDSDDPVLHGRERLFAPVEQATAAPGELRSLSFECDVCGKVTASRAGLASHRRTHEGD